MAFVDIDEAAGKALAEEVGKGAAAVPMFYPCDIRNIEALEQAIAATEVRQGNIDTLVNNAANDTRHRLDELTPDYWDERFAINLRPMVFAARSAAQQMRRSGGGSIINFGSISWKTGTAGMVASPPPRRRCMG